VRAVHHRFSGMEGTELDAEDLRILHALTRVAPAQGAGTPSP
jgi:N-acetylmuramoyl-L-alanine amidase